MGRSADAFDTPSRLPRIPFTHPAVEEIVPAPVVRFTPPVGSGDCEILRPLARHQTDHVLVFDTETTGREGNARIVELCFVKVDVRTGETSDAFESLVNPGMPIPRDAQAVHHISDQMVRSAPSIAEVLPRALKFIADHGSILVAHNASFDVRVLKYEAQRTDTTLPGTIKVYCSLAASRKLRTPKVAPGQKPSHALPAMAADYGITVDSAHRARTDVETLACAIPLLLKEAKAAGRDLRECFPLSGVL